MRDVGVRVRPDFNWNRKPVALMGIDEWAAQLTARFVELLLTIGVPPTRGPISVGT
jgi:hypothetical protein